MLNGASQGTPKRISAAGKQKINVITVKLMI